MSNIGRNPIEIPGGAKTEIKDSKISVTGPLGTMEIEIPKTIELVQEDEKMIVRRKNDSKKARQFHGLTRALIANMLTGVTKGFEKRLKYVGVGYRAAVEGKKLILNIGFSHPVEIEAPEGIEFKLDKNIIVVSGISKDQVGKVAAEIRDIRKPEPYKGKGIMYENEKIRRKAGKSFKAGEGD